jgi:MFS superfamily sulfate permease-like transporter
MSNIKHIHNFRSFKITMDIETSDRPPLRFNLEEFSGAVGDYVTFIPIALAVSLVLDINFGYIILFYCIWSVITGFYYRIPIPIEPMKAIGTLVIVGGISKGDVVASGLILGILFLSTGIFNGMKFIQEKVPNSVVRGIQLGLALLLFQTSLGFVSTDLILSLVCIIIIILFFLANRLRKVPNISAILVLILGVIIGLVVSGVPPITFLPLPSVTLPTYQNLISGTWTLVLPQIPLTITNAILATSLLLKDLYKVDVKPDRLSKTIGLMNLTSVPFGGFPMCHGAGSLAADYRFGARTGGANIISGLMLLPVALFFAGPQFVQIIPLGIFGALLIFIAIELAKNSLKTDSYLVTILIAVLSLTVNITLGFVVGLVVAYILEWRKKNQDL